MEQSFVMDTRETMKPDKNFIRSLCNAFRESFDHTALADGRPVFNEHEFFLRWFGRHEQKYFFLFRRNLSVTNIHFAELLSLIRVHHHISDGDIGVNNLQFVSRSTFAVLVRGFAADFARISIEGTARHVGPDSAFSTMVAQYAPLFSHLLVLDYFYGSAAVFSPSHIRLRLDRICAYSGGIYACAPGTEKLAVFTALKPCSTPSSWCGNSRLTS